MTDNHPDQTTALPEKQDSNPILTYLAEWKSQLLALAVAPFIGIGFVFDFLLRAKDFPELASAMWGVAAFFTGISLFALLLTCAAFTAAMVGTHERQMLSSGKKAILKWIPRIFALVAMLVFVPMAMSVLDTSTNGFGRFMTPYVNWLKLHSSQ